MKCIEQPWWIVLCLVGIITGCNPFAPALDESDGASTPILSDTRTYEGVFENIKYAYTFRDTVVYSQLLDNAFIFHYMDYDRGGEVMWGREEEMRITYELFQHVTRLDLVWNQIVALSIDSAATAMNVSRGFTLTVTFNPSDVVRVDGYANLFLTRRSSVEPWRIVRWKDESNY
ncbi:MAG: hypothetical protein N3A63_04765 [Bacteroidetes bacterium]|nr:hypothetical protein [Bacteroidota bacterium]